jgi:hypothetical protein
MTPSFMLDLFLMNRQAMTFLPIASADRGPLGKTRPGRRRANPHPRLSLVLDAGDVVLGSRKPSTLGFCNRGRSRTAEGSSYV